MTETRKHAFVAGPYKDFCCHTEDVPKEASDYYYCGLPASAEVHREETCRDPEYCGIDGYQCGCRTIPAPEPAGKEERIDERVIEMASELVEWLENEEIGVAISDDALRKIRDTIAAAYGREK